MTAQSLRKSRRHLVRDENPPQIWVPFSAPFWDLTLKQQENQTSELTETSKNIFDYCLKEKWDRLTFSIMQIFSFIWGRNVILQASLQILDDFSDNAPKKKKMFWEKQFI